MTIRRKPADFVVEERLTPGFRATLTPNPEQGRYALYRLRKESMTTPDAATRVGKALRAVPGRIAFGGLKDKHAATEQHVSIEGLEGGAPALVKGSGWSAERVAWSREPMSSKAIEGNRFTVVVRDLAPETCKEMDRRARLLSVEGAGGASELLVMNYFGAQRFGSARHGEGWVARSLIEGDFETALKLAIATPSRREGGRTRTFTRVASARWGDWARMARELPACAERRPIERLARGASFKDAFGALPPYLQALYVEAHQSRLWNEAARRIAWTLATAPGMALRSDDVFGELVFPASAAVSEEWRSVAMPLLASSAKLDGPWAQAAQESLDQEGLTLDRLRVPGVRRPFYSCVDRALFARAADVEIGPPEGDDLSTRQGRLKRRLSFALGRGAYATVVLRALGQ